MIALGHMTWLVGLLVSIAAITFAFGSIGQTSMFPEGRRWWEWPAAFIALAFFALFVLYHPFGGLPI